MSAGEARSGQPAGMAGVVTRGLALTLDAVLIVVVLIGGAWLAAVVVDLVRFRAPAAPELSATVWRVVAVSVFCGYNVVGWWLFGGTLGKALLGVRVETHQRRWRPAVALVPAHAGLPAVRAVAGPWLCDGARHPAAASPPRPPGGHAGRLPACTGA